MSNITKQNITEHLYLTGLINNTDLEISNQLTSLVLGITNNTYNDVNSIQTAIANGDITNDTYVLLTTLLPPSISIVDTAGNILAHYA